MKINYSFGKAGIAAVLLASLTGCTTYVVQRPAPQPAYVPAPPPQPEPVYVQPAPPPPPAVVVIQREDDFYQPLSPYGEWVVVGSYGRCWRPAHVEGGWRPYTNGHWELTDAGWYWVSDEPWAWATYHYGRWQLAGNYGWVWVPRTEWAPAWVSWREGGGYVGWAPLPPEPRGGVSVNVTIAPAAFCFVEERRMHEPVRPTTVIVNNTTIINKTVNITKTKIVNKVVINEGPRADEVERVSGQKIQARPVAELRHKDEEPVAEKHRNLRTPAENRVQPPEQKQPEVRRDNRPQDVQNRQNGNPPPSPVAQPAPRETERPARKDVVPPKPARNVQPEAAPALPQPEAPPAENRSNRERLLRGQNPSPTPPAREVRPVEKPADQPQLEPKNRDRQQDKSKPEVQAPPQSQRERAADKPNKQKNEPAADQGKNAKGKNRRDEATGTNTTENATPRERR